MKITSCNCFKKNEERGMVFPVEMFAHQTEDSLTFRYRYVGQSKYKNKNNPFPYIYCPLCGKKIEYDDDENTSDEGGKEC